MKLIKDRERFKTNRKLNGLFYALSSDGKEKDITYYENLNPKRYKKELKEWYFNNKHEVLNYKKPANFNQKIQWLKMYDCTEIKTKLSDKYENRAWIKENVGEEYLVPLLGVWDNFDDINFDELPNQFVIKCNHGSGFNYIVKDKSLIDYDELRKMVNSWKNTNFAFFAGLELQYKNIKPRIICEEFLGDNLIDIQAWCTNGEVLFISYIYSPHGENKKVTFDENWNKLDFYTSLPIYDGEVKKPSQLKEIVNIAKKVSRNFKFVRVDFYITSENNILISEFTFTPATGTVNWVPESANKIIGDKIIL